MTLNPYQGLKQANPCFGNFDFMVLMTLNPYQGLKPLEWRMERRKQQQF